MDSIRIKNLRSLKDTDLVALKPINVLVGMNSSGKSTFLRTFPLLRQSIERRTRGPLLWNGDYADFESFETSVHKSIECPDENYVNDDTTITFSMGFSIPDQHESYRLYNTERKMYDITCSIGVKKGQAGFSFVSRYDVEVNNHEIHFDFNENGVIEKIESKKIIWDLGKIGLKYEKSSIDSLLPVFTDMKNTNRSIYIVGSTEITKRLLSFVVNKIKELSGSKADKITTFTRSLARRLDSYGNRLDTFKSFKSTEKWARTVSAWDLTNHDFQFLSAILDLIFVIDNSALINDELAKILKNVHYIAPLRASTDRYYRHQDLGLDELDHRGANLAMFLNNINADDRQSLDKWTLDNFNFVITSDTSTSHMSIRITTIAGSSYNIADVGFGYSQILPIIVSLWSISSGYEYRIKDKISNIYIVTIEQPELHLHPKMQADLATIFAKSVILAKENDIIVRFIIETHSSYLVSKFGDIICSDFELTESDVNVMMFDKGFECGVTNIRYSNFDNEGALNNWPIGFFNY